MSNAVALSNISHRRIKQLYGEAVPDEVEKRLEEELNLISVYQYDWIFMMAHRLVRNARRMDCPFGCCGMCASSFVAYLTGISTMDPVRLAFTAPLGLFEKLLEQKRWGFAFHVPEAYYQQAKEQLAEMAGAGEISETDTVTHYYERTLSDTGHKPWIELLSDNSPIMLFALQYETDISAESIPLDGGELLQLIVQDDAKEIPFCRRPLLNEILAQITPHGFADWVRIAGMLPETNGIYKGNAEALLRDEKVDWSELIVHRDELFADLTAHGMDEDIAYQIMDSVRLGQVVRGKEGRWNQWKQKLAECGMPDWTVAYLEKLRYLIWKAHSADGAYTAICLAWFKIHHPQVYRKFAEQWLSGK